MDGHSGKPERDRAWSRETEIYAMDFVLISHGFGWSNHLRVEMLLGHSE